MKNIVIIGYGQLGKSVCERHLHSNDHVYSFSRQHYDAITPLHHHLSIDLDNLSSSVSLPNKIDCLYYFAPPSDTASVDQRLQKFLAHLTTQEIKHLIYISTSGVYGDSKGGWITEETNVNPSADRARRRLNAEHQLTEFHQQYKPKLTILRCAAIYSNKTVNADRIKSNTKPVIKAELAPFTNRIHITDLTEVCWQAMLHTPSSLEIYNVSDGQPSTTTEHSCLLADEAGVDRNKEIDITEADQYYSPAYMSYLKESKRLDVSKLKKAFNLTFKTTRQGVKECLNRG